MGRGRPLEGVVMISSAAFGAPHVRHMGRHMRAAETARRREAPDARLMHQRNSKQRDVSAGVCSCEVYTARILMHALVKKREVPALEGNRYFYVFLLASALVKCTLRVLYCTLL